MERDLIAADRQRVQDLRDELGAGDTVTSARWHALRADQAYFAERLGVSLAAERFRLIRDVADDPPLDAPRWWFHLLGLRHAAVHLVLFAPQGWLITQRRSFAKDSSPGAIDLAVTGHCGTQDPIPAMYRELAEEIGLVIPSGDQPSALLDEDLLPLFTYDALHHTPDRDLFLDRERYWVFGATLTAAGFARLNFSDGEVTALMLLGAHDQAALTERCHRQARQVAGEIDLAAGIMHTWPRWLAWQSTRITDR